jgi:hypothetical protein
MSPFHAASTTTYKTSLWVVLLLFPPAITTCTCTSFTSTSSPFHYDMVVWSHEHVAAIKHRLLPTNTASLGDSAVVAVLGLDTFWYTAHLIGDRYFLANHLGAPHINQRPGFGVKVHPPTLNLAETSRGAEWFTWTWKLLCPLRLQIYRLQIGPTKGAPGRSHLGSMGRKTSTILSRSK